MLVLTRREGERIQIGDGITVTVVRIAPYTVRIGIEASLETVVMRHELLVDGQFPERRIPGGDSAAKKASPPDQSSDPDRSSDSGRP